MITNIIITLFRFVVFVLTFPIRLLDDVVLDANITAAFSDAGEAYDILSTVFPIGTIIAVTALLVTVELAILVWHSVNWIIRKIPTVN